MFYIKDTLFGAIEVTTEIGPDNVFCKCPYCGKEVHVNLSLLMSEGQSDISSRSVVCDNCKRVSEGGTLNG
ncbi:MAG: hypothetical protein IIY78_05410 [Clostridia bacterium]|nr:hypothetical protein [Clostridia bacterium]